MTMNFSTLFTLFTQSGMKQDPDTHQFKVGIAEMSTLAYNIQQEREDDAFFNKRPQFDEDF